MFTSYPCWMIYHGHDIITSSIDDQIKACNKLDYEDLGGALDDRCLVEQLSRFENGSYSNKGNLFERHSVED